MRIHLASGQNMFSPQIQSPMQSAMGQVQNSGLQKIVQQVNASYGSRPNRDTVDLSKKALELLEQQGEDLYTIRVRCTKGTYIRTLCHDIGQALGCGGCMASLRRTMAAGFPLEDAVTIEDVQEKGAALLRPVDSLFKGFPALAVRSAGQEKRVRCGNPITLPGITDGTYRLYGQNGDFLCLSQARDGTLTSVKNFF